MKTLFQYAVILHTYNKEGNYEDSKIIVEPKTALAKSEKDLVFKITREIPEEFATDPDNVEILIKHFLVTPILISDNSTNHDNKTYKRSTELLSFNTNTFESNAVFMNTNVSSTYSLTNAIKLWK